MPDDLTNLDTANFIHGEFAKNLREFCQRSVYYCVNLVQFCRDFSVHVGMTNQSTAAIINRSRKSWWLSVENWKSWRTLS
jgi:hypothetical protein